ncbi:MAG: outer membrane beta-barrel protein [Candidatus Sulfotelmatobacter sp.]
MIRQLVMGLALAMLAGPRIQAQQSQTQQDQTPPNQAQQDQTQPSQTQPAAQQSQVAPPTAGQAPATQESSSQETSDEELGRRRKAKVHDYKNWVYNVDAGANLARDTTKTFVKGGGVLGGAGVARNFNKYFGFRLDFQFVNLPLRSSALQLAQAPSASSHVYAFTLDPMISIPVTKLYTGYFLIGPGYYHRSGKLDSSTAIPGSACNSFYQWWGPCFNSSLPQKGKFLSASQDEFGYNFGGGVARRINKKYEVFGEYRQQHGTGNKITTDWRSVAIGLRW